MKLNVETPSALVDIHRVAELSDVDTTGDVEFRIGAGGRMADIGTIDEDFIGEPDPLVNAIGVKGLGEIAPVAAPPRSQMPSTTPPAGTTPGHSSASRT